MTYLTRSSLLMRTAIAKPAFIVLTGFDFILDGFEEVSR
jgi:hypothetical protein